MTSSGEIITLSGHSGKVHAVAFSPDGKIMASASREVILWRTADWQQLGTIVPLDSANWVVFSPDGKKFEASPGAMSALHFCRGDETFDVDKFKDQFYVRDLLQKLLSKVSVR